MLDLSAGFRNVKQEWNMGNICTVSKGQLKILPLSLPLLFALLRIHVRNSSQPQVMVIPFLQSMDFPNPLDTIASYITMVSNQFFQVLPVPVGLSQNGCTPRNVAWYDGKMMRIPCFSPNSFSQSMPNPIPTWGSNGYGITMVITPRNWDMLGYKT